MMVSISLPLEVEEKLQREASRRGVRAEDLAARIIADNLPAHEATGSLADLFATWEREDHTTDPQEISRREKEAEELKRALNRNREEMEGPERVQASYDRKRPQGI